MWASIHPFNERNEHGLRQGAEHTHTHKLTCTERASSDGAEPVAETVAWVLTTATAAEATKADRREKMTQKKKEKKRAAIKR